jgi:hypothetical protein
VIRSLPDSGAAAWSGGSLMGAVALSGATRDIGNPSERAKVAASGAPQVRPGAPIHTALMLQNSRMPWTDSSRPCPELLIPPKGSCG